MSYVDPDALHGAMSDLGTAIDDNTATLTANGVTPATLQTKLTAIQGDLGAKKGARDLKKTALDNAQADFVKSGSDNYDAFSNLIDAASGGVGKKTPEGKRILAIRKKLRATRGKSKSSDAKENSASK